MNNFDIMDKNASTEPSLSDDKHSIDVESELGIFPQSTNEDVESHVKLSVDEENSQEFKFNNPEMVHLICEKENENLNLKYLSEIENTLEDSNKLEQNANQIATSNASPNIFNDGNIEKLTDDNVHDFNDVILPSQGTSTDITSDAKVEKNSDISEPDKDENSFETEKNGEETLISGENFFGGDIKETKNSTQNSENCMTSDLLVDSPDLNESSVLEVSRDDMKQSDNPDEEAGEFFSGNSSHAVPVMNEKNNGNKILVLDSSQIHEKKQSSTSSPFQFDDADVLSSVDEQPGFHVATELHDTTSHDEEANKNEENSQPQVTQHNSSLTKTDDSSIVGAKQMANSDQQHLAQDSSLPSQTSDSNIVEKTTHYEFPKINATTSTGDNIAECDMIDLNRYHIKWIHFKNEMTPIITQNKNGPCPLLAIMNVLLLRRRIKFSEMLYIVTTQQLMDYLGDCIFSTTKRFSTAVVEVGPFDKRCGARKNDRISNDAANASVSPANRSDDEYNFAASTSDLEQNLHDAMSYLPKLQHGMDVNVRFTGVNHFEYTTECIVYDLLNIHLLHGWLIDPHESSEIQQAVGVNSYNQIIDKIITNKSSSDDALSHTALILENFLEETKSQLTYHGISELNSFTRNGQLAVFFRNNHFSTMYKHNDELFLLVTDQGFLSEPDVVWETLSSVEGHSHFVNSNFVTYHQTPDTTTTSLIASETARTTNKQSHQTDLDYQLALQLAHETKALDQAKILSNTVTLSGSSDRSNVMIPSPHLVSTTLANDVSTNHTSTNTSNSNNDNNTTLIDQNTLTLNILPPNRFYGLTDAEIALKLQEEEDERLATELQAALDRPTVTTASGEITTSGSKSGGNGRIVASPNTAVAASSSASSVCQREMRHSSSLAAPNVSTATTRRRPSSASSTNSSGDESANCCIL